MPEFTAPYRKKTRTFWFRDLGMVRGSYLSEWGLKTPLPDTPGYWQNQTPYAECCRAADPVAFRARLDHAAMDAAGIASKHIDDPKRRQRGTLRHRMVISG